MVSITENYKSDGNLEDIRGTEMYSSSPGLRMNDSSEKGSDAVLKQMINRKLSPSINYHRSEERDTDFMKCGKSPRRINGNDSTIQPPSKKECLSPSSQHGSLSISSMDSSVNSIMHGSPTMPKTSQSAAFPRMTSIPPSALFGFNPGSVGCFNTLANTNPLSALGIGVGNMQQNSLTMAQLSHAIENQTLLNQLAAVHALSFLQSPATNLLHGNNMSNDVKPRTLDHLKQVINSPKTSTPKGKPPLNRSMFLGGGNSSGYVTDSSFNTTSENSLHELVSKMALLPPNKDSLISALGTAGVNSTSTEDTSLDYLRDSRWVNMNYVDPQNQGFAGAVEQLAENHRKSAASSEATCTWVGLLPPKMYKNPIYSCKVFLGGVPWDITEPQLQSQFKQFGAVSVDWPGKDKSHAKNPPSGYVYLIFENEKAIRSLLTACTTDFSNGKTIDGYFFKLSSKRTRGKEVQVIPWVLADSNYSRVPQGSRTETTRTVFVGALHGMLNAEALATIMNDLFGGVTFAGIDTDKYKYPIGSGRVSFNNDRSYMKAVSAGFIEIKAHKFQKKVQVDPYLDDHMCSACQQVQGQYFCRETTCFTYFCLPCWNWHHSIEALKPHVPLTRNSKMKNSSSSMTPVTALTNLPPTPFGMNLTEAPENTTVNSLLTLQSQNAIANAALAASQNGIFGGVFREPGSGLGAGGINGGNSNANVCDSLAAILENANNTCASNANTFSALHNFRPTAAASDNIF